MNGQVERRDGRRRGRVIAVIVAAGAAMLLAGCGSQSPLSPESGPARHISNLWWGMLAAAGVVFAGALLLVTIAWARRRREGFPVIGENETVSTGLVVAFGIVIPALALITLFAIANFGVAKDTGAPKRSSTSLTVEVIGHQWFWEVRYPGTSAVTANELHIPARTRVNLVARTADVIHSFWVPRLNRKIDMVPGRTNRILLYAERPGRYRGQCSEFCGLQHANMGLYVFAQPPASFRAWLARASAARPAPRTQLARRGEQVFVSSACSGCHTIAGTPAQGRIGPDLTHLEDRTTLAALTIPNNPAHLAAWVADPQQLKPGNKMPRFALPPSDMQALLAYLETLR